MVGKSIRIVMVMALAALPLGGCVTSAELSMARPAGEPVLGSAVFLHPDGTGLGHWNAARWLHAGPDGQLAWDRLDELALYRVHQKNFLSTTSHAGATTHAYGRKVHYDSYGLDRTEPLTAASGSSLNLMEEAMEAGLRVGVVNSGHIGEPGTGVFLARSDRRSDVEGIARQVLESGADLIFSGGEVFLLPEGQIGVHGEPGRRTDGRDLLAEARERGYRVIFTREELLALPDDPGPVIGVFAAEDTYNADSEEALAEAGLPLYNGDQPRFDEMVAVALRVLGRDADRRFLLVAEEEGTDNFSNSMNAAGMLEAMGRTDAAIGEVLDWMAGRPQQPLLLVVGADSDAGHPVAIAPRDAGLEDPLPDTSDSGAPLDGARGAGGAPFESRPDAFGNRYPFGIAWPTSGDHQGSAVTRAHGFGAERLGRDVDNTDIYTLIYRVLFGRDPESA